MSFLYDLWCFAVTLLGSVLLLRAYLWSFAISPRDPLVRLAWTMTDWLVTPVAYVVRPRGSWDWPSIASAVLVAVVQTLLTRELGIVAMTPLAMVLAPVAMVLCWGLDLLSWGILIYCVLSFFGPRATGYTALLGTLCDPVLRPFRRIFNPLTVKLRGIDLSPIVVFLLLSIALRYLVPISRGYLMF